MRVLVADDDPVVRFFIEASAKSLGHNVQTCPDGETAWRKLQAFEPQIVVSDWMMPGLDGLELCRRTRHEAKRRLYFILVSSAMSTPQAHSQAYEAGVDLVIPKPVSAAELSQRIQFAENTLGSASFRPSLEKRHSA